MQVWNLMLTTWQGRTAVWLFLLTTRLQPWSQHCWRSQPWTLPSHWQSAWRWLTAAVAEILGHSEEMCYISKIWCFEAVKIKSKIKTAFLVPPTHRVAIQESNTKNFLKVIHLDKQLSYPSHHMQVLLTPFIDSVGMPVGFSPLHCQFTLDSGQNFAILIQYGVPGVASFFKFGVSLILSTKTQDTKICHSVYNKMTLNEWHLIF